MFSERQPRPTDRDMAYASYVKYCLAVGTTPLEQHEYEIETAALTFKYLGMLGNA